MGRAKSKREIFAAPHAQRDVLGDTLYVEVSARDRGKIQRFYGGGRDPRLFGICKYMGCRYCVAVNVPGVSDSGDEAVAVAALEARGWRRSVFDGKWVCDVHAR